ncbi:MAG: insulinase family protein [Opitutaceae bacterium]|nr:insulinase family protein [Opitutaceae bacterium]
MTPRPRLSAALLPLLVLLAALPSPALPPPPQAVVFPHQTSDLPVDPAVRWGRLENGLRYAILSNSEPKGRASLRFAVHAGSLNESEDQRGLAHFLEHMAFNGSMHFAPGTLVEYFQRLGMSFGGDTNALTSFDRTVYLLELPDTNPETVGKALTLFADYGGGLLLNQAEIDKERGIILSERRARDSVEYRTFVSELGFLLPEARLPHRMPIGLEKVVQEASRDQFTDFYDTWYRPDNTLVVAVGDFDPDAVEAQLVKVLSPLTPRAPARSTPHPGVVRPSGRIVAQLHFEPEASATTVAIESITPYAYEPDTAANRLKYLPRDLALRMLNRRLSILAKKEGAPFLGGQVGITEQYDFFRNASIELICQPGQWRAALEVGEQELRRAIDHGFQPAELAEAAAAMRNGLEEAVRTASTRHSGRLADVLVDRLIERNVFTTPAADLALYGPALDRVAPADCQAALREAWSETSGRYLFVSGNLKLAEPEKEILAAYAASRAVPVAPPEKIADAAFAYTDFGPAGEVTARRHVADLDVTLVEFKNGLRLNLKRTDFEAGRIRISVRLGGGRLTEPADRPGLSLLASSTFTLGGLGRHSADDLERLFAGKTVNFSFSVRDDAFVLAGTTTPADLLLQLQLLGAFVMDPGYRPEALRQFQKGIEQAYTRFAHTVEGPLQTEVPRLLACGDLRFGVPPKEIALSRTLDESRAWLAPQLAHGPIELALVGDLDVDAAIAAVARTFGALPAREAKPAYTAERRVAYPGQPFARQFTVPTEIPRGLVEINWPATDARDASRARRLNLLTAVFADRLRLKIREQMGDTYSPGAQTSLSDTYPGYGFIVAEAAVAPGQARAVAAAIKAVAAGLARDGATADELARAKQPILTSLRESARTNFYWLGIVLASAQEQPERLDWCRTRYSDYESITKDEIDALAKQYLDPARAFEFISLPEPQPDAN